MGEVVTEEKLGEEVKKEEGEEDYSAAFSQASGLDKTEKEAETEAGEEEEEEEAETPEEEAAELAVAAKVEADAEAAAKAKTDAEVGEESGEETAPDPELLKEAEDAGQALLDAQEEEGETITPEEEAAQKVRADAELAAAEKVKTDAAAAKVLADAAATADGGLSAEENLLLEDLPELRGTIDKLVAIRIGQGNLDEGQAGRIAALEKSDQVLRETVDNLSFKIALAAVAPEAAEMASSPEYHTWIKTQSPQFQALHNSSNIRDSMAILKVFQSVQGKPKKPKSVAGKEKTEQEKIQDIHGHGFNAGQALETGKAKGQQVEEEFSGAFKEASAGTG